MPLLFVSTECPSEDTVARFLEGDLELEQLERMEGHLATCARCPQIVANAGHASGRTLDSALFEEIGALALPLPPDTRIGRYVVRAPVGTGGMGRVYAAYDPTLDRQVALKLLHPSAANADLEARLLREAKAMARLAHHPEIVPVYDAGRHGAQLFIAMEFVEGGTLRAWLATRPRSWREIVAVFQHAGRGLAHAHAAGLVHRDFKPDNVLVGGDGRVRVTDFGLARVLRDEPDARPISSGLARRAGGAVETSLTRTGTLVGTPAYMAPEQLDGADADARSDIFSFCVALFEALHGERPFRGSTIAEIRNAASAGRISPSRGRRPLPRGLSRVLHVGLRPRPDERQASMNAVLEALQRVTREPTLRRASVTMSLLAAAGTIVAVLSLRSGHSDPPRLSTPIATTNPIVAGAAPHVAASEPSAVVLATGGPESPSPLSPAAALSTTTRPSPAPRPHVGPAALAAPPQSPPGRDAARVVEGRNGAPIMR